MATESRNDARIAGRAHPVATGRIARRRIPRPVQIFLVLFGAYLVVRGIVEPFVIDVHDPSTYHLDWGGPSLLGVLAVHSGPAVFILAGTGVRIIRGRR